MAPHCPLPRPYCRPARRFAAYDFVQAADPSVSALALVAGDRRIVEGFRRLGDGFCAAIEPAACSRHRGAGGSRLTGRMLAGQFYEPNNRWLMPFLHVHTRVLNFTSFGEEPAALSCIDTSPLARAAEGAKGRWAGAQADMLAGLGYRVAVRGETAPTLSVEGVSESLVSAMDAPRVAVLRILERALVGERPASAQRLEAELPAPVIAAMAEQIESLVARSLSSFKPPKVGIPSEGPWRACVREHLSRLCPGALARIDAAAALSGAGAAAAAVFPSPRLDHSHCHAPELEAVEARAQAPSDPELGTGPGPEIPAVAASPWLALEFQRTLDEVNERLVRAGPADPLVSLRALLPRLDNLTEGADPDQLRQSGLFLGAELERHARQRGVGALEDRPPARAGRGWLPSLEELIESAQPARVACEREIGGRSL